MSVFQGAPGRVLATIPVADMGDDGATPDVAPVAELSKLTKAQLLELCDGRGIGVPKGATKAQLLALLEGTA